MTPRAWFLLGLGADRRQDAGALRVWVVIHRSGEWLHRTLWLAWSSLASWISLFGLSGAAAGAVLALLLRRASRCARWPGRPSRGPRRPASSSWPR